MIVATALLDVLVTALHPTVEGRLSARFHRAIWTVVRRIAAIFPDAIRETVLSWTLPLSVAGQVLSWLLILLAGFALIYLPGMSTGSNAGGRGAFRALGGPLGWGDAFYFSGVCLTTVGFGDIVPLHGLLRAVSVAEGLTGLLVIGVAVIYVLAVFPVLPIASIVAMTLNEEADGQINGVPLVRRYLSVNAAEPLAQRCRDLATHIMTLSEAHTTHPVLFYAHPPRVEQSFLRVLIVTQRLVALLRYGLRRADYPTLIHDPRVVGLEESLIAVLHLLGSTLHVHVQAPPPEMEDSLAQEYRELLQALKRAKLRGDMDVDPGAQQAYVRFRLATDPYVDAYGANSGYAHSDLWGSHPPLRGNTAPIPGTDDDTDSDEGK